MHVSISTLADRALTLRQLRDVGVLLQRLCKTRVLVRSADHFVPEKRGTVMTWSVQRPNSTPAATHAAHSWHIRHARKTS